MTAQDPFATAPAGTTGPGRVLRATLTLLAGTAAARALGLLSLPLLTRLCSPADFGLMAGFAALVLILSPLTNLRYVLVIALPKRDGVAVHALALALICSGVSCAGLALALAGPWDLLTPLGFGALQPWAWLIALTLPAHALVAALSQWSLRGRNYGLIARATWAQAWGGTLVRLGLVLAGAGAAGLMLGQAVALGAGARLLLRGEAAPLRLAARRLRLRHLWRLAWAWRGFPLWRLPAQALLALAQQGPLLFVTLHYGSTGAGQLSLALNLVALPVSLLGTASGQALYAEAARSADRRQIAALARSTMARLFLIGLAPALLLGFGGETLFALTFGPDWAQAGHFAALLALPALLQLCTAPLMQLLTLRRSQALFLALNLGRALLLGLVFALTLSRGADPAGFVQIYAASLCLLWPLLALCVLRSLRMRAPR